MTKAERNAINAYKKDLIAQGVDKEIAATMAIWLGKQYLGQKDQVEASVAVDVANEDALSKALREEAERMQNGTA